MPLLVSSGWAASILGFLTFGFTEFVLYMNTPKEDRAKRLKGNLVVGLLVTLFVYSILFVWSTIQTVYDTHQDSVGRWQLVVKEKDSLKAELQKRDDYIKSLEARKCPVCPPARTISVGTSLRESPPPSALSQLQKTVLLRDLKAGSGLLTVRINSIGNRVGVTDYADEIEKVFKGWNVDRNITGQIGTNLEMTTAQIEFVIPQPQAPSVQIAVRAFDNAHVTYTKTVSEFAYRGSLPAPALTINVR
jgi:hypothetical protein